MIILLACLIRGCEAHLHRIKRLILEDYIDCYVVGELNTENVGGSIRAYIYGSDMELWGFPEDAARLTFEDYAALLAATFPATMRPERL